MDPRNDEQVRQELLTHVPPAARRALFGALDMAYRDAGARFDPEVGSDMQHFGFSVYKYAVHRLKVAIDADPSLGLVPLGGGVGAFLVGAGPLVLSPYSCGTRAPDDPWSRFPNNDKGAGQLSDANTGQGNLFSEEQGDPVAFVIAHYGNPSAGLEALYLKRPADQNKGRISQWDYVEEVYRIGDAETGTPPTPPPGPSLLPGPAKVTRPTVLPFKKRPAQDGDAGTSAS